MSVMNDVHVAVDVDVMVAMLCAWYAVRRWVCAWEVGVMLMSDQSVAHTSAMGGDSEIIV